MPEFGDHDDDDTLDTAPPDPEQVARKLRWLEGGAAWEELTPAQRQRRIQVMGRLLAWMRRSGHLR